MKKCIKCDVALVSGQNWTKSRAKKCVYICRTCVGSYRREWRKANKGSIAAQQRWYYNTNAGRAKRNSAQAVRTARKLAQTPWMSQAEYAEVEAMYLYNVIMPGTWHIDHIQPLAKGGLHHPTNLQLMGGRENESKNARWDCCDQAKAAEAAIQRPLSLLLDHAQRF